MQGIKFQKSELCAIRFPETTSVASVNRQCSSGLQAVASIAAAIGSGHIDIGIGAGMESMSQDYGHAAEFAEFISETIQKESEAAANCLLPMGITSENVAAKFKVSREKQDAFAATSFSKAVQAQKAGKFNSEIIPVKLADGTIVSKDDGIRETTLETLTKLRPSFRDNGTTTAGNSSQVSDGAAAVLIMRRSRAKQLGLPVLARFVGYAVAGVPPEVMGIGPAFAIPAVLSKCGLSIKDIDVFEINEAFASQAVYSVEKLGIDPAKVNPNGGAIALGHPLGCTGARQIATLLPELKRRRALRGIVSMCIGSGMGAAAIIENEQL